MITADLTAGDTWSDTIIVPAGHFNFSIWGTFVATITVQRSFDDGTTWLDCEIFATTGEWFGTEGEGALYRAGIKAADYTSGTASIRMAV